MTEMRRIETSKILCLEGKGTRADLGPLFQALGEFLTRNKVAARGDRMAIFYDDPLAADETRLHYSAALELGGEVTGDGEATVVVQSAGRVACETHRGEFSGIRQTYERLFAWIREQGYRISGPVREYYLEGGPGQDESRAVTEIQVPVEKAEA